MSNEELKKSILQLEQGPSYSSYMALSNVIEAMDAGQGDFPVLRVAILRNFTVEPLLPILKSEIMRMGYSPEIYLGDYDNIMLDIMDQDSAFYGFNSDIIIISQWLETLSPALATRFISLSREEVLNEKKRIVDHMMNIAGLIRKNSSAKILLNNFPLPDYTTLGILDVQLDDKHVNTVRSINQEIRNGSKQLSDVYIVDFEHLMSRIGYQNAFDERYWHMGKAPISRHALITFGTEYTRFMRAFQGKAHKCLILDCDNTLWGGVVGEDGIDGIKIDNMYPGSCYLAFQREILNLHHRGVILALCSKNNEEDVLEVFRKHPEMLLREEHFSTWQINWEYKSTNIKKIVHSLNIGMDSVVFVDDSEYEIGLVKSQIPEITVLKLSKEPSRFRADLCKMGYFDSLSFSMEDSLRNKMYKEEEKRKSLYVHADSLEEYLAQLDIHVQIRVPDPITIPRVAQLTQKTNQFNLTTIRYTESDISDFVNDPNANIWYLKLRDKISDMGIVGVAIVKHYVDFSEIDSFLFSCRALGRGAEDALYAHIIKQLQAGGVNKLKAKYRATGKNAQVSEYYNKRGFTCTSDTGKDSVWELNGEVFSYKMPEWITLED